MGKKQTAVAPAEVIVKHAPVPVEVEGANDARTMLESFQRGEESALGILVKVASMPSREAALKYQTAFKAVADKVKADPDATPMDKGMAARVNDLASRMSRVIRAAWGEYSKDGTEKKKDGIGQEKTLAILGSKGTIFERLEHLPSSGRGRKKANGSVTTTTGADAQKALTTAERIKGCDKSELIAVIEATINRMKVSEDVFFAELGATFAELWIGKAREEAVSPAQRPAEPVAAAA